MLWKNLERALNVRKHPNLLRNSDHQMLGKLAEVIAAH